MLDLLRKYTRKFLNSFAILPYIFQDNHFKIFKIKEDVTNNTFIYAFMSTYSMAKAENTHSEITNVD